MPGRKAAPPPPIDRPLSKAYLRKFTGWSTAMPPGMSDPTSLRVMHNCNVDTDGSLRIRPGLRRVFSNIDMVPGAGIVGTFEHFYANDGAKCLLFAVREDDGTVGFRVAKWNSDTKLFDVQTLATQFATSGNISFTTSCTYVKYVQIDNKILALAETTNASDSFLLFSVGNVKKARELTAINRPNWSAADTLSVFQPQDSWRTTVPQVTVPTAGAVTDSLTDGTLEYSVGYWYTFNNEIGESAPSAVQVLDIDTRYTAWNADPTDDRKSLHQLACVIPQAVFDAAWDAGATSWNLYFMTWSNQDSVPVTGVLMKTTVIPRVSKAADYQVAGWVNHTPLMQGMDGYMAVPTEANRVNYTQPFTTGQGLVAGDRMVLVYDKLNAARIRWSSNQQGNYLNLSASVGGGYKTLTSGDLYFPACVKLWQNPQSVDTLTVLCMGLDGEGTAYYMNPGSGINTQSQNTKVMGFEETTATPGTVSPYGVEVLNNALYHPLDNNLMKSTASNYNINHLTLADPIQNLWRRVSLSNKRKMVSSQMDSTLYYLVRGPEGTYWTDDDESRGAQIWTLDTAQGNIWSCWDVAGSSLRKLEIDGQLYMAVCSGRCIFVLDPEKDNDDAWDGVKWVEDGIPWEIVTNTQGANRAHDAWCYLQQVNVTFGNFTGECVYGIRGYDANGQLVEVSKHYKSPELGSHSPLDRYDQRDFLRIGRTLMEWEFFWRSHERPKNRSYGSISYIQYRYTPATVNIGYEYGSVETFEYLANAPQHSNGVPMPMADTVKP